MAGGMIGGARVLGCGCACGFIRVTECMAGGMIGGARVLLITAHCAHSSAHFGWLPVSTSC
jgi:hypothetical protein